MKKLLPFSMISEWKLQCVQTNRGQSTKSSSLHVRIVIIKNCTWLHPLLSLVEIGFLTSFHAGVSIELSTKTTNNTWILKYQHRMSDLYASCKVIMSSYRPSIYLFISMVTDRVIFPSKKIHQTGGVFVQSEIRSDWDCW